MLFYPDAQVYYYFHICNCGPPVSLTFVASQNEEKGHKVSDSTTLTPSTLEIHPYVCNETHNHCCSKLFLNQMQHPHCICNGIIPTIYTIVLWCCCTYRGGVTTDIFGWLKNLAARKSGLSQE